MALKLIAVDGCTLAHASGSLISGGVFTITSTPSLKVKAENKGVFKTPLAFTFTGGNASGFVAGSIIGSGVINSTATKVKAENMFVMLEGDFVLMNATGTLPPPTGGTAPIAGNVEISAAGQTKVNAQ